MIYTTLNKIRAHKPCADGWAKLLRHLGKAQADDEPLAFATILDSNGLCDALWCLRVVDGHQREMRLYAVWCARQVQHLMDDQRSLAALDIAERYANGQAMDQELLAARAAAKAAMRDAAGAPAEAAALSATESVAWFAVSNVTGDAARAATVAAAKNTALKAAKATSWTAAWAAAESAAESAQTAEFRRVFCGDDR